MRYSLAPAFILGFLLASTALLQAQTKGSHRSFSITMTAGPSIALGSTRSTTGRGAVLDVQVAPGAEHRFSWTGGAILNFNNLPNSIVAAYNMPSGQIQFSTFVFDPVFTLMRTSHWRAYLSGGGGFGVKDVQFIDPNGNCDGGCVVDSKSSWQPAVNASAGFAFAPRPRVGVEFVQETTFNHLFTPAGSYAGFETAGTSFVSATIGFRINFRHPAIDPQ